MSFCANDNPPNDPRGWRKEPFDPARPDGAIVRVKRQRDFLFPDAHRKYEPAIDAYIEDRDLPELFRLIDQEKLKPADAVARFRYLSPGERIFATRALTEGFRSMEKHGHLDRWPHLKTLPIVAAAGIETAGHDRSK